MKIGFHIPFSGNLKRLSNHVIKTRGNVFQFYSRTMKGGRIPEVKETQLRNYYNFLFDRKISGVIMHAPYAFKNKNEFSSNLAVPNEEAVEEMIRDLEYAKMIHAKYYVINAGYAKQFNESEAIDNLKKQLINILERTSWDGTILVRNMAGGGTEIAADLYRWGEIITFNGRIKGAIDFARAFSYGYNFLREDDAQALLHFIEREIGWANIPMIYINDSNRFSGSKRNDVAPLGDGVIGFHGYNNLLKEDEILKKIWIVENQPEIQYYDRSINYLFPFHKNAKKK